MQTVIAVCVVKNSGKTALLTKLVSKLSADGSKIAVIKHDGHDFDCDMPGTDTYRFAEHGAYGTACFSGSRSFVQRIGTQESYEDLIRCFPEADIIFIEGAKDSDYDKIEVIRKGISTEPASCENGRFLIATDLPGEMFDEETMDINDVCCIADRIKELIRRKSIETCQN